MSVEETNNIQVKYSDGNGIDNTTDIIYDII